MHVLGYVQIVHQIRSITLFFANILNFWNLRIFKKIFSFIFWRVTFIGRHGRGAKNMHLTVCLYFASDRLCHIIFMVFLKFLKINFIEIFTHDCKQFFLNFFRKKVLREFDFFYIFESTKIMQSIETAHKAKLRPQREKIPITQNLSRGFLVNSKLII